MYLGFPRIRVQAYDDVIGDSILLGYYPNNEAKLEKTMESDMEARSISGFLGLRVSNS